MDIARFHELLLGMDPTTTPERWRLAPIQKQLYDAYPNGARGFWEIPNDPDPEAKFIAMLVLALAQTRNPDGVYQPVVLVVPPKHTAWASNQIKEFARYVFRSRKGKTEGVRALRDAFHQLHLAKRVLQISAPERWAGFGFPEDAVTPEWLKAGLIHGG